MVTVAVRPMEIGPLEGLLGRGTLYTSRFPLATFATKPDFAGYRYRQGRPIRSLGIMILYVAGFSAACIIPWRAWEACHGEMGRPVYLDQHSVDNNKLYILFHQDLQHGFK